jgi:hypothetical protein
MLDLTSLYVGHSTGISKYVSISANSKLSLLNESITIMMWINLDLNDTCITQGEKFLVGTDTFGLRILNGNYVWGLLTQETGAMTAIAHGDTGNWVHICGQYNGNKRQWLLYKNGHLVGSASVTGPTTNNPTWYIGGRPNLEMTSQGIWLSQLWIFNSIVSVSNMQLQYIPFTGTGSLPPTTSTDSLVAYWPMTDGTGTIVSDRSSVIPLADGIYEDESIIWKRMSWFSGMAFVELGSSINDAIQKSSPSIGKPYNIYLAPGDFNEQVILNPWISLIGSGQDLTTLNVPSNMTRPYGSVVLADHAQIRQLEIVNTANTQDSNVYGIELINGSITFEMNNVVIYCDGGNYSNIVKAMSISAAVGSTILLTECILQTKGGMVEVGLTNQGANISLDSCIIESLSPDNTTSVGILSSDSLTELTGCYISSSNVSIFVQTGATAMLQNCQINGKNLSLKTSSTGHIIADKCQIIGRVQGNVTINTNNIDADC